MKKIYQITITQYEVEYSLLARLRCLLGLNLYQFHTEWLQSKRRQNDDYHT